MHLAFIEAHEGTGKGIKRIDKSLKKFLEYYIKNHFNNKTAIIIASELLIYPPLSSQKLRDSLHTLNELVIHQETKVDMINNKIVLKATNLM